ncbi:MAG: argininosuccinate synthase [Candidatus Brocadiia bacterium]
MANKDTVILAYSGGLDTSVAVRWIQETYDLDVITLTIDMGTQKNLETARQKALRVGAVKALVVDACDTFVDYFCWPALQAGAVYENVYPLATALGRPLIAKLMVDTARDHDAVAIAHGCTGKGNDQVRFDVATRTLAPDLDIIAPAREWDMTREDEIQYAKDHDIDIEITSESPYSTDENIWGRSIECGVLEDPWAEPPADAYEWTVDPAEAPDEPRYVEIEFEQGVPVALDGEQMDGTDLIARLNDIAGAHGVGRLDHVENRLVGIKSREIYEAPAAVVLHEAHRVLEGLTLTRPAMRFKEQVAQQYADVVYDGLWYSGFHQDLRSYVQSSQRTVSGTARMKLYRGNVTKAGVKSPLSLYSKQLATYDEDDAFEHQAAIGFIKLHGLPSETQARMQEDSFRPAPLRPRVMPPELKPE